MCVNWINSGFGPHTDRDWETDWWCLDSDVEDDTIEVDKFAAQLEEAREAEEKRKKQRMEREKFVRRDNLIRARERQNGTWCFGFLNGETTTMQLRNT